MTYIPNGTRVHYSGAFGTDFSQPGTITGRGEKNGRVVLDVRLDTGADHWGYLDQFKPIREIDFDKLCSKAWQSKGWLPTK